MYRLKTLLESIQTKLQQISIVEIGRQGAQWLYQKRRMLCWGPLGIMMLQLLWGRLRFVTLEGEALGTHYKIQYFDRWGKNYQQEIEALLGQIEQALSTALSGSELSRFNEHDCTEFYFESPFFYPVFAKSKEVYRNTGGAFDPTIPPLLKTGHDRLTEASDWAQEQVDSPHEYVSLDYVVANEQRIKRLKEGVKLDFGGILRGYAVDQIAKLLGAQGIDRAWIVLGKELVVKGKVSKRKYWPTPIHPYVTAWAGKGLQITMELIDKAVAISSRQLKEYPEGIADPTPGAAAPDRLLAAVVVAPDCVSADAYATAMMVRGLVYAQELVEKQKELEAFLIYEDDRGAVAFYSSSGLVMKQKKDNITLGLRQERK